MSDFAGNGLRSPIPRADLPSDNAVVPGLSELVDQYADYDRSLSIALLAEPALRPFDGHGETAQTALQIAITYRESGHSVTIALPGEPIRNDAKWGRWHQECAAAGIMVATLPAPDTPAVSTILDAAIAPAYAAYEWLKTQDFDVIQASEFGGLLYYALIARHLGIGFAESRFVIAATGPTLWRRLVDDDFFDDPSDVALDFMEQSSLELADVVVAPNAEIIQWLQEHGVSLSEGRYAAQPFPQDLNIGLRVSISNDLVPVREVVYLGPLSPQRGLYLFFDAVTRLNRHMGRDSPSVIFLAPSPIPKSHREIIRKKSRHWVSPVRIVPFDAEEDAIAFLATGERLVVIPSYRKVPAPEVAGCLDAGVPIIATTTSNVSEAVAPDDAGQVICPATPTALARCIERALREGASLVAPRFDAVETKRMWSKLPAAIMAKSPRSCLPAETYPAGPGPRVTVCLMHYERPRLVWQALASVESSSYENLDVVLVDDGSASKEACDCLDALEERFRERGWKLIRQENRYLGAARNTAARHAGGKYLYFLDDDNVLKPEALKTLVEVAERTEADILTSFADIFEGVGNPAENSPVLGRRVLVGNCPALGLFMNGFGDGNALIRREVYLTLGGNTETFGIGKDDQEFFARAVLSGYRLFHVPEPMYWQRRSEVRLRDKHFGHRAGEVRVLEPYLRAYPRRIQPILAMAAGMVVKHRFASRFAGAEHIGLMEALSERVGRATPLARFGRRLLQFEYIVFQNLIRLQAATALRAFRLASRIRRVVSGFGPDRKSG